VFLRKDSRFSHDATVALQHRARELRQLVEQKRAACSAGVQECPLTAITLAARYAEPGTGELLLV
jgi:Na+-translocating ferredoxin:NAD+ oxidoreductase RNF subunit RnfB